VPQYRENGLPLGKEMLAVGMKAHHVISKPELRRQEGHAQVPARYCVGVGSHHGVFVGLAGEVEEW